MAFIPTTNCAKVAIEWTWEGQKCVTTLWFTFSTIPVQADLVALATHCGTNFVNAILTSISNQIVMNRVTATRQDNANDIQGVYTPGAPVAGTGAGLSVPLGSTWVFTHRTLFRGRSFRGRTYLPGMVASIFVDAGTGNITTLAGIAAAFVQHFITAPATNWTWNVVSHFANKVARTAGLPTLITSVSVDALLDSQRRRLIGRGA